MCRTSLLLKTIHLVAALSALGLVAPIEPCFAGDALAGAEIAEIKAKAERGSESAQVYIGAQYESLPDYAQAAKWYRLAAERGNAQAQAHLGFLYNGGKGVARDYAEAAKWYREAAEQGTSSAQSFLCLLYVDGKGAPQNFVEAYKWCALAALQESESAKALLAQISAKMTPEARNEAQQQAAQFVPLPHVENSSYVSVADIKTKAESGDAKMQFALGNMYFNNSSSDQSKIEAAKWYRKAGLQGLVEAQLNLGYLYRRGDVGIDQNQAESMTWFRKAADQGNARAQTEVGDMYFDGRGAAKDFVEAAKWFHKAADQGNVNAQDSLGLLYLGGRGVPQNYAESYYWYFVAARQKSSAVKKSKIEPRSFIQLMKTFEANLTPEQLAEIETRAAQFVPE